MFPAVFVSILRVVLVEVLLLQGHLANEKVGLVRKVKRKLLVVLVFQVVLD